MDYARLWFGFDGMAANGLRYGSQLEVRMSDGSQARGNARGTLQYRRMYGYVATPTLGQLRVGSGQVRASELMYTGHMNGNIATGLWDGDMPAAIIGGAGSASLFWYSASNGNNMTAITYLSPQFFGFDAGLSYAPSDGNFGGDSSCGVPTLANGGTTCDRLSETNLDAGTAARLRNIYDVMLRYRGSFGPVGLVVSGGLVGAESIGATGTAQSYQNVLVGIGGSYAVAPGMNLYAEYLYGRREENGVNLQTGQLGAANNKTTANVFGVGLAFNW